MGAQLGGFEKLPYASCVLEHSNSTDEPLPERSGFRLGSLTWDVPGYAQDPKLEPFRNFYRVNCKGTTGIVAAVCVSDVFAQRFPFGAARRDYCDRSYDPAAILAFQLKGNPGHCMQRSGLLAAVLLSNGIPARVIQILAPRQGHTIVEVWVPAQGWLLFDPSTGCIIGNKIRGNKIGGRRIINDKVTAFSAMALVQSSESIKVYPVGLAAFHPSNRAAFYEGFGPAMALHVLYPEPWLYLRTGQRFSSWPFRGRYVSPENLTWRYGLGQRAYIIGILISLLAALACAVMSARAVWRFGWSRRPLS